jgi:hypothetical protein
MTDVDLLAELLDDLARDLRSVVEPLTAAELAWQPGPQANSIGVTLWHIARGLDLLATRVCQAKPAGEELWHTRGWRERTGYDPRGIGYGGWGVLTGYSWAEVEALPEMTVAELLQYLEESCTVLTGEVRRLTPESVRDPAPGLLDGKLSYYQWLKSFYKGFQAHVGEILAIQALMKKAAIAADQA